MSKDDINQINDCMKRFKSTCEEFSNNNITISYKIIEIENPIKSMSYDEKKGYYIDSKDIAKDIGFNIAYDSKGILVEKSIFIMKDLRNAIAHNNVIFDTRFNTNPINNTFKNMIMNDMKISDIFFNCITDYIIFVSYMLKKLKRTKNEINKFITEKKQFGEMTADMAEEILKIIENLTIEITMMKTE